METVEVRRVIAAPISAVFDWLSDAHNYTAAPFFLSAKLIRPGDGTAFGPGAVRRLTFPGGLVREEITEFDRPFSFRYRVVKSVPPVRHDGGAVLLSEKGIGTEVRWTSTAELRLPVFAAAITRMVFPALFGRAFAQVLDAAERELSRG